MNSFKLRTVFGIGLALLFIGCADRHPTYSQIGGATQTPGIEQILNRSGSLTLKMKGNEYYGNLVFDPNRRFELNPLIKTISGNAKGTLVSANGSVVTCVMELQEETKSGSGHCLEENNPKLLKIHLINMEK